MTILWAFDDGPLTCANSGTTPGADLTWAFYYGYGAYGEEPADVPDAGVEGLYGDSVEVHLPHIAHGPPVGFGNAASAYSAPDNALDLSGDFSIELILRNTETPAFNLDVFLQKRTGATSPGDTSQESAISIVNAPQGAGDRISFAFLNSLTWTTNAMVDFTDAWNQIGVTRNSATGLYKFYRNGALIHSTTGSGPINFGADGPWVLGHKAYFTGKSADHTRWQRALITDELLDDAYFAASWEAALEPPPPEPPPPGVWMTAEALSSTRVRLTFNAPVFDSETLRAVSNYSIEPPITIYSATPQGGGEPTYVDLRTSEHLLGENYTVTMDEDPEVALALWKNKNPVIDEDYSIQVSDGPRAYFVVETDGGEGGTDVTIELPSTSEWLPGDEIGIERKGEGTVTIIPKSGTDDTVMGEASVTIDNDGEVLTLENNATTENWEPT